jgi:long-chain acyl-CoA synthetase
MYTGKHAHLRPLQPAFIMAATGEAVTYRELEARSNRLAHLFRKRGLKRLDHYAIFMENNSRYLESCGAGERAGIYYTCVNSYLTPGELAYILTNSESRILITSKAQLDVAREAIRQCPKVELCIVADGEGESDRIVGLLAATAGLPSIPIADEHLGTAMLYSSGTTGRPKGILRPLPEQPPEQNLPIFDFLLKIWQYREGMVYLSPAPLYHSAPQAAVHLTIRSGGTAIIMESFDPERYLALIEQWGITHTQLVPTMFSRMLKLPEEARTRYDLSSLEIAIHAAAPCPAMVKDDIIKWWGPRILRRHRRPRLHRLQQRGMAGASRHRRARAARRSAYTRCEHAALPRGHAGHGVVQDRNAVRVFQRSEQDRGGPLARRQHEHGRRCRLCRQ